MRAEQAKEFIPCFPRAGRCSASPGQQDSITYTSDLGKQTPSLQTSLPFFLPQILLLSMVWDNPWVIWGQLSPGVPSQLLAHHQPPGRWGGGTGREGLDTVPTLNNNENTLVLSAQTQNTTPFQPPGRDLTLPQPPGKACSYV